MEKEYFNLNGVKELLGFFGIMGATANDSAEEGSNEANQKE